MARKATAKTTSKSSILYCSFCGKSQHEVHRLIAGPSVFICDECVQLCVDILIGEPVVDDYVTNFVTNLRKALGIAEKKEVDVAGLGFKPRFKKLRLELKEDHAFFLCPFAEPYDTIYKDHVRSAVSAAGFEVNRADEIFGTEPIIEDIWESIISAEIVIADVSGRNPNVMYEIGMAHAVGKPVLIMTQDIEDVPFDLRHHRCIIYSHTPRGCADLENAITNTLKFVKGKKPASSS